MPSFLFWPFAILFHPPPVFPGPLHIISLTSLPLTLVSSFCSPFQPSFQENITSSMVIHHQKFRTMRKIAVQHLKEWHCPGPVFFMTADPCPRGACLSSKPHSSRQISGWVWAFSWPCADEVQSLCKAISPRTHRAEMQMPLKCWAKQGVWRMDSLPKLWNRPHRIDACPE